ncbi:enoyl-CoA hydratase/isomerase family protein [Profundibacter sp.]
MSSTDQILVSDRFSGASWVTINRQEKHNALSKAVLNALAATIKAQGERPEIKCIVLTGASDRYFAAGGDLAALADVRETADVLEMTDNSRAALDTIRNCEVPVIALLNGSAIGGGAELALSCDMRMQRQGVKIGFIQAKLGITPAWGGGVDLVQLVGPSRAVRMMSRCEMIDADTALDWGLADKVIGPQDPEKDIEDFLAPILSTPRQVLRGIKAQARAFRRGDTYSERRLIEQQHLVETWLHQDHWDRAENLLSGGKK